jgi:Crp-like helix-turn-helix domain
VGGGGVFGERSLEGAGPTGTTPRPPSRGAASPRSARGRSRDTPCALALLAAYGGWAQRKEGAIARLLHRGVRTRLASLLLELDVRPGLEVGPGGERLTQERLAEMVACCREAVSPDLASLRREGVLGVGVLRTSCVGGSPKFALIRFSGALLVSKIVAF